MAVRPPLALLALLFSIALPLAAPLRAAELPEPEGQVVLTVAGAIENTNRPPFDAFEDGFLHYHEKRFEKAAAFDLEMLEGLGLHEVDLKLPLWIHAYRFEGPRLADLMAAVGATGRRITVYALDGYAVEIGPEELARQDWVLAIKRDGAFLGVGQRGPTWLVYARGDGQPPTKDDEARWPWSVFYIEVQ